MAAIQSYRDLVVWQKSRQLVSTIYQLSDAFPHRERFGLTSQLRRAAVSIPSNISEGSSKRSTREFIRFLNIAHGSLCELETQLFLAQDLGYSDEVAVGEIFSHTSEIGRMINGLISKLEQKLNSELRTLDSANA